MFKETIILIFITAPAVYCNTGMGIQYTTHVQSNEIYVLSDQTLAITHRDFHVPDNVTRISIENCEITEIEPGALCKAANLTEITILESKNLPYFPKHSFKGCKNLQSLNIFSSIRTHNDAFLGVGKHIENVTLLGIHLPNTVLRKHHLKGLEHAQDLSLSFTPQLRGIGEAVFEKFKSLKNLALAINNIEFIEDGAFETLNKLEVLNLEFNNLTNLDFHEFTGLESLKHLSLFGNYDLNGNRGLLLENLPKHCPKLEMVCFSFKTLTDAEELEFETQLKQKFPLFKSLCNKECSTIHKGF